jgi:rubrerythrin
MMTELFSIRELLEVAIQEEQTGAAFYRALAQETDDDELEAFCIRVAEMEDAHENWFRDMLDRCRDADIGREAPGEYLTYMAQDRVLTSVDDAAQLARSFEEDAEAVNRALALEREALLFFLEVKEFVPADQVAILEEVIDEERQHVTDWMQFKQKHYA